MSYFRTLGRALVGRAEVKESRAGFSIARHALNRPVWNPRSAEQQAKEGYQQNVIAYSCIRMIATCASALPFYMMEGRGDAEREIDSHPLLDLLERPNPMQSRRQLIEADLSFLLIAGNSFMERTQEGRNLLRAQEVWTLRPDRMTVVPGETGLPRAYEHKVGGGTVRYDVDFATGELPILHKRHFNPLDDWYGMSPLDAAAWSIDTHNDAARWNKALLDNGAAPSGALIYGGDAQGSSEMGEQQFQRLKRELLEMYSGSRNAGRPLVLDGGLDWKQMGLSPNDMQFSEAKAMAAREICFAFGVPPMMLGIPGDNTYSNFQEAQRAFYRNTVIPTMEMWLGEFMRWMAPLYERNRPNMRFEVDLDRVPALEGERREIWDRIESSTVLTINEKREALDYAPLDDEDADRVMMPSSMVPMGVDPVIPGGPEPDDDETDPPAGE